MAHRVVSTAALALEDQSAGTLIDPEWDWRAPVGGHWERSRWLAELGEAKGLIALLTDAIDEEVFDAAPQLRVVANHAVGYDNVDIDAATRRGIVVTNTPGVLTEATADFTLALLLAVARRLVEGHDIAKREAWTGWEPGMLLGTELRGATLGLLGFGRIGQAVAVRARAFGMRILVSTRSHIVAGSDFEVVDFARLVAESDFLSLHCPLTPQTREIIDAAVLAAMKPTAVLLNTARGGCVDEAALVSALYAGEIAGAGLDVFASEPRLTPGLAEAPGVVLAPHIGSATHHTRSRMASICLEAIRAVLSGKRPVTPVNPSVYEGLG